MSSLTDILKEIDSLRSQLDKLKPMKAKDEERLWKKFRLEWNYNSNHIEGNTLTYGQTELLIMFDKTTGDHEMREYEEMKAHDAVIHLVREFAKDKERGLSEADIRQWNKTILVREFWSDAQTQSGQPTRKKIIPGEYKKEPNSVLLQNGEMFHYASPEETPLLMSELINWYRDEVKKKELHPVQLAALLHYKFVRIHPFDDSNGRTSRLLMNYELLRNDLPPVIIKSVDKKNYLFALNKADVGDIDAFVEYIADQIKWSLNISLKAGRGESIGDKDDIYKEISIWKKSLSSEDLERLPKNIELIRSFFIESVLPLFERFIDAHKNFNDTFVENQINIFYSGSGIAIDNVNEAQLYFWDKFIDEERNNVKLHGNQELSLLINHQIYKPRPDKNFYFSSGIKIYFNSLTIEVEHVNHLAGTKENSWKFYYSEKISNEQLDAIVADTISKDFEKIKGFDKAN